MQALGVVRPATLLVSCNQAACIVRCTVPAEAHIVRCAMMVGSSRSGEAVVTKEPSPPSAIAARRPNFTWTALALSLVLLFFIRQPSADDDGRHAAAAGGGAGQRGDGGGRAGGLTAATPAAQVVDLRGDRRRTTLPRTPVRNGLARRDGLRPA